MTKAETKLEERIKQLEINAQLMKFYIEDITQEYRELVHKIQKEKIIKTKKKS